MSYSGEDFPNYDGERIDGPGPNNPEPYENPYGHPYDGLSIVLPDGWVRRIIPTLPEPGGPKE